MVLIYGFGMITAETEILFKKKNHDFGSVDVYTRPAMGIHIYDSLLMLHLQ